MIPPGPLRLEPVTLTKVWAAEHLEGPLGAALSPPPQTGEIWLASDRHNITRVAQGELAGQGLDQVMMKWGEWLAGPQHSKQFPLLLKVLNVGDWLSVQVHPDDEEARRLENEPWGKSEAWHVLQARPGAEIVLGLKPGVDHNRLQSALQDKRLEQILAKTPASAGDTFHISAGEVHAIGPGLVLFEVQQASDVTYRFYDWDRPGPNGSLRELHQEKALQVVRMTGPGETIKPKLSGSRDRQISCLIQDPHFVLYKCRLRGDKQTLPAATGGARVLFVLHGKGYFEVPGTNYPIMPLKPGDSWLIPAGLNSCLVSGENSGIELLDSQAL